MEEVVKSIVVNAPVSIVYERWTHIEDFTDFMKSLKEVSRINEIHFRWRGELDGREFESVVEVSLQIPKRRLAWRSISGPESSGVVYFEALPNERTLISYKMMYVPDTSWQDPAALGLRLEQNLLNFKGLIEG